MKTMWQLLKAAFQEFKQDNTNRLAAALSYYTAISIAPLLVFMLLLLGFVLGQNDAESQLTSQLETVFGEQGMEFLNTIIANADQPTTGTIAGVLSLLTLIWGSTNVFSHLQETLNVIWDVRPKPDVGIMHTLRKRLLSFAMVLGIGFLFAVSLILSTVLSVLANTLSNLLPGFDLLWQVAEYVISFAVITLLFAAMFKVLPDVQIKWRDVWPGAALTALLFTLGKVLLTFYLSQTAPGSAYGAAGSVIVFLLWVYYTAIILFFGAEFTQVYAVRQGSGMEPEEHAIFTDRPVSAD